MKMRDSVEICMAHDKLIIAARGEGPLEPQSVETSAFLLAAADVLAWSMGLPSEFPTLLGEIDRQCDEAGFEIVPDVSKVN